MKQSKVANLYKSEDWLSVWIGFIVIAVACIAVATGAFDFSAMNFKTWTLGESLTEAQSAKIVPLGQQLASGAFWIKTLVTFGVLGLLFTIGAKLTGEKVRKFLPAFVGVFLLTLHFFLL